MHSPLFYWVGFLCLSIRLLSSMLFGSVILISYVSTRFLLLSYLDSWKNIVTEKKIHYTITIHSTKILLYSLRQYNSNTYGSIFYKIKGRKPTTTKTSNVSNYITTRNTILFAFGYFFSGWSTKWQICNYIIVYYLLLLTLCKKVVSNSILEKHPQTKTNANGCLKPCAFKCQFSINYAIRYEGLIHGRYQISNLYNS